MRIRTPGLAVAAAVILCQLLPVPADAQSHRASAPVIRLTTALGGSVTSNYIEPMIRLSEDAYVFAISVDVDRNVQVLHPDLPGISVKMNSRRQLYLPSFFAGYGERQRIMGGANRGYFSSYYDDYDPGFSDERGTIIALASREPFNLAAVTRDGAWDVGALKQLVYGRNPLSAASALARELGAKGEPIGRDVHRFAGAARYYQTALYDCYYAELGYGRGISSFRAAQLRAAGYAVHFLGIDACGMPQYVVSGQRPRQTPVGRPPAIGAFPRPGLPVAVPRNPTRKDPIADRMATRVPTARPHTERDVTTRPPKGRTTDPRSVVDRVHSRPATGAFPERARAPERSRVTERSSPPPRADVPERRATPAPAPRPVERPRPAPEARRKPAEGKRVDRS